MEGNMAGLCRKLAGSENPKKVKILLEGRRGTGWLIQKIGGI
jgi:hypothetical protein